MLLKLFDNFEKKKCLEVLGAYGLTTQGNYWWVRYPKRAVDEIFKMQKSTSASLSIDDDILGWKEWIVNNFDSQFRILIKTQENHPYEMPKVFLKEPYVKPSNEIHMYKDGSLCLMHPDSFNSRISILEIRNLAAAWCFCFEAYANTGKWPAAEYKH